MNAAPESSFARRREDVEAVARATPMQQGMLFHSLEARAADPYFRQLVFVLRGCLERDALQAAWEAAVARHPVLRADYHWEQTGLPVQVIFKQRPVVIQYLDWSAQGFAARERLSQLLEGERRAGYDLRRAADLTLRLIQRAADEHWLVWSYHHVTLDGWSLHLVLGDVLRHYHEVLSGRSLAPEPPSPYARYVGWIHEQNGAANAEYWRRLTAGFEGPVALPGARPRHAEGHVEHGFTLDAERDAEIGTCCAELGITFNTLVQAAWALLLGRSAGRRDVVFGATVSGRSAGFPGAESIAGLFINTLPVRVALPANASVPAWLQALQRQNVESRRFEHTPLSEIQRLAGMPRGLFDSIVVFENYPVDDGLGRRESRLEVELLALEEANGFAAPRTNYALTLNVVPGVRPRLTLAGQRRHYDLPRLVELGAQLRHLLRELTAARGRALGDIALEAAGVQAFESGGSCARDLEPVLSAFARHARERPRAPALQAGRERWSYAELAVAAERIAAALARRGVVCEDCVVLYASRTPEFVAGMLGVLRAGAAYVPVDARLPLARLDEVARDSAARFVLVASNASAGSVGGALVLSISALLSEPATPVALPVVQRAHAAYVLYTSGSTGRPKGVVVSHGALALYVQGLLDRVDLEPDASMAMVSTIGADLGHTVLFGALCSGRCLHLLPEDMVLDAERFGAYMHEHGVGALKIVPSHFHALLEGEEPARAVPKTALFFGGERLDWSLIEQVRALRPGCRVFNHYGPTETTVGVALFELEGPRIEAASVPIGRPLPGVELYVLDTDMNRLPVGEVGELYVGGERLARGYAGSPALTAARLVPSPFGATAGSRLYRTGDRVRWCSAGVLEFLGRSDRQHKIRGHRVELGEVEARLRELPGVREAVATTQTSAAGTTQLVAYVVPSVGDDVSADALRERLRETCPDPLVPSQILVLERLPLTANGKIDHSALPRLEPAEPPLAVGPPSPLELELIEVWREVLRLERVGVTEDFFALGGDSLVSLQLIVRAGRRGLKLTSRQILEYPTIRALAAALTSDGSPGPRCGATTPAPASAGAASEEAREALVLMQAEGRGAPLYCLHDWTGDVTGYARLARALAGERPVYGVRSRLFTRSDWVDTSIESMGEHCASAIAGGSSAAAFRLLGWSLGSRVALETARALVRRGHEVSFLGLVDDPWLLAGSASPLDTLGVPLGPRRTNSNGEVEEALRAWVERAHFRVQWEKLWQASPAELRQHLLSELTRALETAALDEQTEYRMLGRAQALLISTGYQWPAPPVRPHAFWARETLRARGLPLGTLPALRAGFDAAVEVMAGDHFSIIEDPALHRRLGVLLAELR